MRLFGKLKNKSVNAGKHLLGVDQIKQGYSTGFSIAKELVESNINPTPATDKDEVQIPIQQVDSAKHAFKRLLIFFSLLFVFGILYTLLNLVQKNWIIALLALAFSVLCLSLAFRYHFWLFQIKKRMLGMDFKDYYQAQKNSFFAKKPKGRS